MVKMEFVGLDRQIKALLHLSGDADVAIQDGMAEGLEVVATRAKEEFVPVDLGTLRSTIHATAPERKGFGVVEAAIVAGGPAAPYALVVHERLDMRHTVGGAKYLERPLNEERKNILERMSKSLAAAIRNMKR